MSLLIAILLVACFVNHAFEGTNPVAFAADIALVLLLTIWLASC